MSFAAEYASERSQQVAIRDPKKAYTWGEVDDILNRCANGIISSKPSAEQRIAVFAENSIETALVHMAGMMAGVCVVPVNFHLTAEEVAYILNDSGSVMLFAGSETVERALRAAASSGVYTVIAWDSAGLDKVVQWQDWLDQSDPSAPDDQIKPVPHMLYTSGTTGFPKGVSSPPTLFAGGETVTEHVSLLKQRALDRFGTLDQTQLVVGPMYHTGPLGSSRQMIAGLPTVILGRFDAEKTLAAIEKFRIETCMMVPTHFVRLLALPEETRNKYDISSIKQIGHTGAKCPVEVKRAMIDWFGPVLNEAYGASEVGTTNSITSEEWLKHPGSVGKTVPPFTALILDEDNNELPPNTEGRLFFRDETGRGIIYHNDPEKSAAAHIAPGVFTIGEIGYVDEEGYVYITDRFNDMVVSGGVNIYPAEAEHVLMRHPAVADVACIGIPHPEMGEELRALVIPEAGVEKPDEESLLAFCREQLSRYKCPRTLEYVDDIGRNTMGKINKRKLREPYWSNQ